jgi:hypothetical protein
VVAVKCVAVGKSLFTFVRKDGSYDASKRKWAGLMNRARFRVRRWDRG